MNKRALPVFTLTVVLALGLVLVFGGSRGLAQQTIEEPNGSQNFTRQTAQEPSLFDRLGGYGAIAAVTDDFLARMIDDPQLGRFFEGDSEDSLKRARQLTVEFICNATGGPCFYIGRTMETTHRGMGITEDDWEIAMVHLADTLDKFQVPANEQQEVKGFFSSLRPKIVDSEIAAAK
jgi:hemoglobin